MIQKTVTKLMISRRRNVSTKVTKLSAYADGKKSKELRP